MDNIKIMRNLSNILCLITFSLEKIWSRNFLQYLKIWLIELFSVLYIYTWHLTLFYALKFLNKFFEYKELFTIILTCLNFQDTKF